MLFFVLSVARQFIVFLKGSFTGDSYIDGLVKERHNSFANALELRLCCTNRLIYSSGFRYYYWEKLINAPVTPMIPWNIFIIQPYASMLSVSYFSPQNLRNTLPLLTIMQNIGETMTGHNCTVTDNIGQCITQMPANPFWNWSSEVGPLLYVHLRCGSGSPRLGPQGLILRYYFLAFLLLTCFSQISFGLLSFNPALTATVI